MRRCQPKMNPHGAASKMEMIQSLRQPGLNKRRLRKTSRNLQVGLPSEIYCRPHCAATKSSEEDPPVDFVRSFGGASLFSPGWRKLWIISILLAAPCGFIFGWQRRIENPPFNITIKTEEPPR